MSRTGRSLFLALLFASCLAFDGVDRSLDLPVEKPTPPPTRPIAPPPVPPENGDDGPPSFYGSEIKSENGTVFFVIDVSGSMSWDEGEYVGADGNVSKGNRLDRAKAELTKCVAALPSNFQFGMLAYDCSAYPWEKDLQLADASHKASAIGWVAKLEPGGGTGTGPACALALQDTRMKLLVLLTDGAPNCYLGAACGSAPDLEDHRRIIREANKAPAVVNVYGIGASGIFRDFCVHVASDGNGTYTDVR